METVKLKLIVESLNKCVEDFSVQYEQFKEDTLIELPDDYDKFMHGLGECYEALGVVIGTAEVENIKNRR